MSTFTLYQPCRDCPFRTDRSFPLRRARKEEIADALLSGQTFDCHKTVEHDEEGEGYSTSKSLHCAGAAIILEKLEMPNQMMRICERIGMYDRRTLDMDAPVFDTFEDWIEGTPDA